jgi:hypothetical protein
VPLLVGISSHFVVQLASPSTFFARPSSLFARLTSAATLPLSAVQHRMSSVFDAENPVSLLRRRTTMIKVEAGFTLPVEKKQELAVSRISRFFVFSRKKFGQNLKRTAISLEY